MSAAIEVVNLSKRFRLYHQQYSTLKQAALRLKRGSFNEFWAVNDVSFEVPAGVTLGIIGENGSGKSTLLKCIAGILKPDLGRVEVDGRLAALLELGAGFHPEYSGRENIFLNGALLGLSRRYIEGVLDEIVAFSELAQFIDNPVKTYSSGMYARLGFSIAVHLDPDVLAIDEILAVGDESFQRRCYSRIARMQAEGRTLVFVSHDLGAVRDLCSDCVWMDHGKMRAHGPVNSVIAEYLDTVKDRDNAQMLAEVDRVHELVPTGRDGVGVTRVRFFGPDGPGQVFETGQSFEMKVEYHAPAALTGARFSVGFVREDGVVAYSTSTADEATRGVSLPAHGEVGFRLPSLPLLDGAFKASVVITDIASEEPYTILERAFPFRVQNPRSDDSGLVTLAHEWIMPAGEVSRTIAR